MPRISFRIADSLRSSASLYFHEGLTQTLSTNHFVLCSGLPTHFVRRLPYTSTRGLPKPFQQITSCFVQDCQHSLRSADFQQVGLTQTLSTNHFVLCSGLPTLFVRRLPYTSTRGLPKPFQQITSCFVGFFNTRSLIQASLIRDSH